MCQFPPSNMRGKKKIKKAALGDRPRKRGWEAGEGENVWLQLGRKRENILYPSCSLLNQKCVASDIKVTKRTEALA